MSADFSRRQRIALILYMKIARFKAIIVEMCANISYLLGGFEFYAFVNIWRKFDTTKYYCYMYKAILLYDSFNCWHDSHQARFVFYIYIYLYRLRCSAPTMGFRFSIFEISIWEL